MTAAARLAVCVALTAVALAGTVVGALVKVGAW